MSESHKKCYKSLQNQLEIMRPETLLSFVLFEERAVLQLDHPMNTYVAAPVQGNRFG